jgi:polysaccharide biosynthesis/export protein
MLMLSSLSLVSCITNKSTSYLQETKNMPQYELKEYAYYRIQPNDELAMQVLSINEDVVAFFRDGQTSSMPVSYKVYADGTIDIPFISGIHVAGLTVREAAKKIEVQVREFAPDATVKLGLSNDFFYLVTEGNQGKYPLYKEKLTLFQALSLAGNIPVNADRQRVRIIRQKEAMSPPIIKEFDMRSKSIIHSEFYYIQPNDIIYVSTIKADFYKVSNYSTTIGTISTTLSFLLLVLGLF